MRRGAWGAPRDEEKPAIIPRRGPARLARGRRTGGAAWPAALHGGETIPELPDITVYVEALGERLRGDTLRRVRVFSPFLLRTALPPIAAVEGAAVTGVERLGKRIVIALQAEGLGECFLVLHLMIAGRLQWKPALAKPPPRGALAHLEFGAGTLVLTEAGTRRRASLHLVHGRAALRAMDAGGVDPIACGLEAFAAQLAAENHTLKRVLTDPHRFSGIGNAYSDEILHRARLSPVALSRSLSEGDTRRLWQAARDVLSEWTRSLRAEATAGGGWPRKVTAFRAGMAVHGRYGMPCPDCGAPVQRIVHADNETNYCARCQTGGRLLADRALSRLLRASWPRRVDDLD